MTLSLLLCRSEGGRVSSLQLNFVLSFKRWGCTWSEWICVYYFKNQVNKRLNILLEMLCYTGHTLFHNQEKMKILIVFG